MNIFAEQDTYVGLVDAVYTWASLTHLTVYTYTHNHTLDRHHDAHIDTVVDRIQRGRDAGDRESHPGFFFLDGAHAYAHSSSILRQYAHEGRSSVHLRLRPLQLMHPFLDRF